VIVAPPVRVVNTIDLVGATNSQSSWASIPSGFNAQAKRLRRVADRPRRRRVREHMDVG
jgi:hypothetical protein